MKTCRHCGCIEPDNAYKCSVCERALLPKGPGKILLAKAGLTVVIPPLVWVVMTRLLRV